MTDTPDPYRELREAAIGAAVFVLDGRHRTLLGGLHALPILALLAERDRLARDERPPGQAGGDTAADIIATMRAWPAAAQVPAPLSEAARLIGPVRRETEHLMTVLQDLLAALEVIDRERAREAAEAALRKSEERAARLAGRIVDLRDSDDLVNEPILYQQGFEAAIEKAAALARAALAKEATDG